MPDPALPTAEASSPTGGTSQPDLSESNVERLKIESNERIEMAKNITTIWEKTIDTQMHFNEMSVKSRQLGLTLAVAALGFSITLLVKDSGNLLIYFHLCGYVVSIHATAIMIAIVAAGIYAVRWLDLGVYHKMLRGAVRFGEDLEQVHLTTGIINTTKGLTQAVTHFSCFRDARVTKSTSPSYLYEGNIEVTAHSKLLLFYRITIGCLLGLAVVVNIIFGSIEKQKVQDAATPPVATKPQKPNEAPPPSNGNAEAQTKK